MSLIRKITETRTNPRKLNPIQTYTKKMRNPSYPLSKRSYPKLRKSEKGWNEFKRKESVRISPRKFQPSEIQPLPRGKSEVQHQKVMNEIEFEIIPFELSVSWGWNRRFGSVRTAYCSSVGKSKSFDSLVFFDTLSLRN